MFKNTNNMKYTLQYRETIRVKRLFKKKNNFLYWND